MLSHHFRNSTIFPAPRSSEKVACLMVSPSCSIRDNNTYIILIAYIGIAKGSPCVVPSSEEISLPPVTNNLEGIM